ncbi:uncharacterized protein LOC123517362 [Portunus trituberculatus]|uniref:uncharacterized protein LOC123517362 n=1 Tax=Portunus trituberculatus TaxID=210409 RepID=UPI001E1CC849|nr:uncharacterized protein LOC123517362 [Portunus trituberculatus]
MTTTFMETSKNYTLVISQAWHLERLRNGAKIPDNDFTPLEPQRLTLNEAAEIRGCHALEGKSLHTYVHLYAQMRTSLLFRFMTYLACTLALSPQESPGELRNGQFVTMLELRRLNRPSSSQSIYHNVKIVLDQQEPLPTLHQWVLTIDMGNGTQTEYKVQAEDAYQKEVEFEADITYGRYVHIRGKNSQDDTLIHSYSELNRFFLSSRVARVGTEYNEKVSSLRVWPGAMTEDVTVGQYQCQRNGVPCYYLSTTLPLDIPRCVINYNNVKQCDDFITDFQKLSGSPELNITPDGLLTIEGIVESSPVRMEAVVFDPQNHTKIFSPQNFECQLEVKQGVMKCEQKLKDIGNQQKFMVLLVSLNQEGYVLRSAMKSIGDDPGVSSASTGVIVGSVVGAVFGVALLAGVAVLLIKKRKKRSSSMTNPAKDNGASSARYDAVSVRGHSSQPMDA